MKMQLISLTLDNFKSFDHRQFNFGGKSANIYGDNGTGKTTIYDALTFLLFGKSSAGLAVGDKFQVKPLISSGEHEGEVKDHAAVTSVEAVLLVDGAELQLQRTYKELWTKKRGSSEATSDGHVSEYYINYVPVKKGEFVSRVGEIISEDRFRLLTSIRYFAGSLPWQDRRAVLFELAGVGDDREIMATDQRFDELTKAMGAYDLDDYKRMIAAKRRSLNGARSDIPARIDECGKTVEELSKTDFAALERERESRQNAREALRSELDAGYRDEELRQLDREITQRNAELQKLDADNTAHRQSQKKLDTAVEESALRRSLAGLDAAARRRENDLKYLRDREKALDAEITACRDGWDRINAEVYSGGELCPTCGQKLPESMLQEAKDRFERDKQTRKQKLVEQSQKDKWSLDQTRKELERLKQQEEEDSREREQLGQRLRELSETAEPEITDLPGYCEQRCELADKLEQLEVQRASRVSAAALRRKQLHQDLERCEAELDGVVRELAKRSLLQSAQKRMEELREQAAKASAELEELDQILDLIGDFTRYKVQFVEESINRRFSLVRFRLFREQINGGIEDCCDVMVGGVLYSGDLNKGMRMNAGIDIINTLSRHYDAYVPLIVDDAESVTKLERAGTQVIRLVVSEGDKELRCELA